MDIDIIHGLNERTIQPVKAEPERKPAFIDLNKQELNAVYNRVMKKLHREPVELPNNIEEKNTGSAVQQWMLLRKIT